VSVCTYKYCTCWVWISKLLNKQQLPHIAGGNGRYLGLNYFDIVTSEIPTDLGEFRKHQHLWTIPVCGRLHTTF